MIKTRKAELKDSKTIFEWRNDQLTRAMSHATNIIDWKEHSTWFVSSLENKNRLLLLCENKNDSKKIALVRFDVICPRALVSINLAPDMRGKGISKQCLCGSIASFKSEFPQVRVLDAEVKLKNIASQRLFESVGFFFVGNDVDTRFYEYFI
jgi:RimJ/RimL family protein N-acetyltransferase